MSDPLFLWVAVAGTFATVLSAGVAWALSARERRPGEVLEAQLQSAGVQVSVPERVDVSKRLVAPMASGLAAIALRLTPAGARDKLARKLVLAGSPQGWTPERLLAVKGMALLIGLSLGYLFGSLTGVAIATTLAVPAIGLIGWMIPGAILGQAVIARQERIRRSLADTIDLLTISVEAGLSFDAALLHVRRTMRGPLSQEIGRLLHEIQLGVSRADALRHLGERVAVPELKGFVLAMVQADVFGVGVANVLRAQSHELRVKRRQRAEERAMKIPVKLLFPMIGCIMPALFIVIMAPAAIKIFQMLIKGHI
jgi:tight adherence protein C